MLIFRAWATCGGVNAFSQDWSHHNNWLCPPGLFDVQRSQAHEAFQRFVPIWKSAHFWPLLCSDGVHWSNFIHDWVILPNFPNLFIACKAKNYIFGCKPLLFVSVALRIDFPSRVGSESSDASLIIPWQFYDSSANFCRSWFLFSCIIYSSKFILRV